MWPRGEQGLSTGGAPGFGQQQQQQSVLTRRCSNTWRASNPLLGAKEKSGFSASLGSKFEKGGLMAEESPFETKGALRVAGQKSKNTPQQTRENHSDRFIPYRCTGKNLKNVFEAESSSQRNSTLHSHNSNGSSSSDSSGNSDDSASEEARAPRAPVEPPYLRRNPSHPERRTSDIFGNEFANSEQLLRHSSQLEDTRSYSSSNSSSSNCNQPNVSALNYNQLL